MFVRDYMTRHPVMIEPDMSIVEVQSILADTHVRHLPVVETGKRLVGLVTRQSLRVSPVELSSLNVWEITRFLSNLRVKDVMVKAKDVISVGPDTPLEEAAWVMARNKIGCLPVLEDGVVVGIITEIDLLTQLTNLLGGGLPGVRVTIRMPNKKGELAKVAGALAAHGWGLDASGGLPAPKNPAYWDLVIKIRDISKDELLAVLQSIEGHTVLDIRETP